MSISAVKNSNNHQHVDVLTSIASILRRLLTNNESNETSSDVWTYISVSVASQWEKARRTYSITNTSSIFGHSCSIRHDIFPSSKSVAPAATGLSTTIVKATATEAIGATATTQICSTTGTTCRIVIILVVDQAATIIDDSVSTGIIDDPCRSRGGHRRCGDVDNNWRRRLPHFDNTCSSSIWCLNVGDRCWFSN